MCLPVMYSDYIFLCSKYGIKSTSGIDGIKDAVMHSSITSVTVYF